MRILKLIYLALPMLLAGCTSMGVAGTSGSCKATGDFTLNVRPMTPKARPANRCTAPGAVMVIKIRPSKFELNEVSIVAKTTNPDGGGLDNWLTASNSAVKDEIHVTVPDASYFEEFCDSFPAKNCEFSYGILARYRPIVDPKVTVR